MANLNLFGSTNNNELANIAHSLADNSINWLWSRILEVPQDFPTTFFRYGMPQKWPSGKYGYRYSGKIGMHARPEPKPHDHRITKRFGEIPSYEQIYGSFAEFEIVTTHYPHRDYLTYEKPELILLEKLKALSQVYPDYLRYLSFSILKGKNKQLSQIAPLLDEWVKKYIEPSNGANDGYPFYQETINLSEIINVNKVKQHRLKEELKKINDELVKDTKKIEYDHSQNMIGLKDKKWMKENFTNQETVKFIGLCIHIKNEINKIMANNAFTDVKYKVKNDATAWEGIIPQINPKTDLVLFLPKENVEQYKLERVFSTPGETNFNLTSDWFGIDVEISEALDKGTAYLVTKDLVQIWFMPSLSENLIQKYPVENTVDHITRFGHSIDLINIHCNMYFTTKA